MHVCCEVIIWAKFGHFECCHVGQVSVIIWAKFVFAYFKIGFKRVFAHSVIILFFFLGGGGQLSGGILNIFPKTGCKHLFLQISQF